MRVFWIGFGIPFTISLLFPLAIVFNVPSRTKPARWFQNSPPFSIYMLSTFPMAVGVFCVNFVSYIDVFDINTYGSQSAFFAAVASLFVFSGFASIIVVHDFVARPIAP